MSSDVSAEQLGVVIVGAGLAGFQVAVGLAQQGYAGAITLIGDEPFPPYDRPPLSKQYQVDGNEPALALNPELPRQVKQRSESRVVALDTKAQHVLLANDEAIPYDRLVLAMGTRPRRLPHLETSPRVRMLRTIEDARAIRTALQKVKSLLVLGGGPIGLELAATAAGLGVQSSVVELAPRLMGRSVPAAMAELLLEYHRENGMVIHLGRTVAALDEAAGQAVLDDGQRVPAELVVVGIGVQANDELAAQAGIACDDGIFVDGWCRTTGPNVYAVGDVTRQCHPVTGHFERIETWANAQGQGQALAAILCKPGEAKPYGAVPWFWSDQGQARLQCAGAITGDRQAWRIDAATGARLLVQWTAGRLTGVAALNAPRDFVQLKRLIVPRPTITPEQLTAPEANIRALVQQALNGGAQERQTPMANDPAFLLALCPLDALSGGTIGSATLPNGIRLALYLVEGQPFATDDRCTHGNSSLADEGCLEGHIVECGMHLGTFDVRTGAALGAPCAKAIRTYPVEIRDGQVMLSAAAMSAELGA